MDDLETTANVLKALANKNRLIILREIKQKKSITVGETAKILDITIAAASSHLQILEKAEILSRKKRGLNVTYRLMLTGEQWVKRIV